jgi:hypothetical protein
MLHKIEAYAGLLSGLAGIAGLTFFLFGPTGVSETFEVSESGTVLTSREETRVIDGGITLVGIGVTIAAVFLLYKIARSAWAHGHRSDSYSGIWLVIATVLLWTITILGSFSIGFFLLPAALLAFVSLLACGLGRNGAPAE